MNQRALIIKFGAIGDVIMAIPAAHELFRAGFQIDWVCGAAVEPVLACYSWIHAIPADDHAILTGNLAQRLVVLAKLWSVLAGRRYDLCATLYFDWRYRLLSLPIRARRRVMLSASHRRRSLLPGRHHTNEFARVLLEQPDGEQRHPLAPVAPELLPASSYPRIPGIRRVILAPAGAKNVLRDDALRRWPPESYAALAQLLLEPQSPANPIEVVLIGGPDDAWIVPAFDGLPVVNLIGALSLTQTLALLDAADILVTHDSGPLHLGGITGIGLISIFGPTDPRGRLPQRAGALAIWGGEGFACRPCYDGRNYAPCQHNGCVRQVTPELVVHQVHRLFEQRTLGYAAAPHVVALASTVPPAQICSELPVKLALKSRSSG
jgi:heptosyltransferase-2